MACPNLQAIGVPAESGIVVDLDFLPEPHRANWIGRALTGAFAGPVLVHGHGLSDSEASALSRRGMTVCRGRLRRRAFRKWVGAVTADSSAAA